MKRIILFLISLYQRGISQHRAPCCRYSPSCSVYAKQAILEHGTGKGLYLALRRILRCHPFSRRDWYDPVPPTLKKR